MAAIARQHKTKAEHFTNEAEKKLATRSWFASKEKKYEDAAELFDKAGNAYKVGGLYHEAGEAYQKAAYLYRDELSSNFEATKMLQNAASCFKKSSPQHAVETYNEAIDLMAESGRVQQAAKLSKECAELYENENIDTEEKSSIVLAIEAYEQAAELFSAEDATSHASSCRAKIAELCSAALDPPDFLRASRLYDDLGRGCLGTNMLKFNAKGYFMQGILCYLASGDSIAASRAFQRYEALDYTFAESREGRFCAKIIEAVEGYDTESFSTACVEWDRIQKLDPWKTSILLRVKRTIDEEDEEDGEVDLT